MWLRAASCTHDATHASFLQQHLVCHLNAPHTLHVQVLSMSTRAEAGLDSMQFLTFSHDMSLISFSSLLDANILWTRFKPSILANCPSLVDTFLVVTLGQSSISIINPAHHHFTTTSLSIALLASSSCQMAPQNLLSWFLHIMEKLDNGCPCFLSSQSISVGRWCHSTLRNTL
jgi:hypothetical protein